MSNYKIPYFDGVADGPNPFVARAHPIVNADAARVADFNARRARQTDLGPDSDGKNNQIRIVFGSRSGTYRNGAVGILLKSCYRPAQAQCDPFCYQVVL